MASLFELNKAWSETQAGTGAGAVATHAAATGVSHIITHVSGHSDTEATLQLRDGASTIAEWSFGGGASSSRSFNDDADATKVLLRAGDTLINSIDMHNVTAADAFLQLFDAAATGDVTLGTTVPNYVIPNTANGGVGRSFPVPLFFTLGVVYASTTATGNDSGAAQDLSIGYSSNKQDTSPSQMSQSGMWVCTPGNAVNAVVSASTADCQVNIAGFSI